MSGKHSKHTRRGKKIKTLQEKPQAAAERHREKIKTCIHFNVIDSYNISLHKRCSSPRWGCDTNVDTRLGLFKSFIEQKFKTLFIWALGSVTEKKKNSHLWFECGQPSSCMSNY